MHVSSYKGLTHVLPGQPHKTIQNVDTRQTIVLESLDHRTNRPGVRVSQHTYEFDQPKTDTSFLLKQLIQKMSGVRNENVPGTHIDLNV